MSNKKDSVPIGPSALQLVKPIINSDVRKYVTVSDTVDEVIEKGAYTLYLHHLRNQLPSHYSDYLSGVFKEISTHELRPYDPGESVENYLFYWNEEEEPVASPLDSWSKLSVKISQPNYGSQRSQLMDSMGSLSESMSSVSSKIGRPATAKRIAKNLKEKSQERDKSAKKNIKEEQEYELKKIEDEKPVQPEHPDVERLRKDKEDKKKAKIVEAEVKKKTQHEEKVKEEQVKALQKELKGKEFTFGNNGEIVILKPLPKELPPGEQAVAVPKISLDVPTKVLVKAPDHPEIVVEPEKKAGGNKVPIKPGKEKEVVDPSIPLKQVNIREVFQVKPGVVLKVAGIAKEGPEFKADNRMKKSDYLQKIADKERERAEYYKNLGEKGLLEVEEEKSSQTKLSKNTGKPQTSGVDIQLPTKLAATEIRVHEQERLMKLLMEEAVDPRKLEEIEKKKKKKAEKLAKLKEEEEKKKKANILENRITYFKELPDINQKDSTMKRETYGIHKIFEDFNKKIISDQNWGIPVGTTSDREKIEFKSPKMNSDMKVSAKHAIFEGHIYKEPRERGTVNQKKLRENEPHVIPKRPTTALKESKSSAEFVRIKSAKAEKPT